ncbi:UNVERIFIED_CONTAM: hypothetical protein Sradi_2092200 [Sesamum radiatum]|uniref:Ty3-gypsy retrotransposon protein n=1 Tax=Sesamum radiatum TaxID=300843 RepID=A0AAW2TIS6_SESRA
MMKLDSQILARLVGPLYPSSLPFIKISSIQMDTQGKAVKLVNSKLTISKSSSSSTKSIGVTTRSMLKKLKDSSQMTPLTEYCRPNHIMGKQVEAHDEAEVSTKQHYIEKDKFAKELQISSDGLIPMDQLKEFIERTIRSKIVGSSKSSLTYSKSQRIDNLKMPIGYQPPKFQKFDGKSHPKQHVAHFVETCNNVASYGDHLVKQFVRF